MGRLFFVVSLVLSVTLIQASGEKDIQHEEQRQIESPIPDNFETHYRFDQQHTEEEENPACKNAILCTDEGLADFKPRFNKLSYTVMLERGSREVPYNATTYRGHPGCLCDWIRYRIVSEMNNKTLEPDTTLFTIDSFTGEVTMVGTMKPFAVMMVMVEARNDVNGETDTTTLTVYLDSDDADIMQHFSPFENTGYDVPHSRHKRAISQTDVYFVLEQLADINITRVGNRIPFRLNITFPVLLTDMRIELFAPDNETTVMILCDVKIDKNTYGSNLNIVNDPFTITKESKTNDIIKEPDHVIIDLGDVDVIDPAVDANTLIVDFEAIVIENPATKNDTTYWVSVGAEYGMFISVAQASFNVINDGNVTVADDAQIDVDIPSDIAIGDAVQANVTLYLPAPTRDYIFKVSAPPNTVAVMSVCALWYVSWGSNFACGNNDADIEEKQIEEPQGDGTMIRELDLKTLLNKGSRDDVPVIADSSIQLVFIVQLLKDNSPTVDLIMTLEMDQTILMVGNHTFNVLPESTSNLPTPTVAGPTTSLTTPFQATIGESFSLTFTITIPSSTAAGKMTLTLRTPFSGTPLFSVCSFRVTQVGQNIPCLLPGDIETEYLSDEVDGEVAHYARMDLGYAKNMQRGQAPTDDEITVFAVVQPLYGAVVTGTNHDVILDVNIGTVLATSKTTPIHMAADSTATPVTNLTQPTFEMALPTLTGSEIEETGDGDLLITMTTLQNIRYDQMVMEFLTPTPTGVVTPVHICKVKVEDSGLNLPCLNPGWTNNHVQYFSTANSTLMDRAKMSFGSTCNVGGYSGTAEDKKNFHVYFKVLDDPSSSAVLKEHILSSGLQFSDTKLWTGTIKVTSRSTINIVSTAFAYILGQTIIGTNIPVYYLAKYYVLYKIEPGAKVHLRVEVTSNSADLDICNIRIVYVGENLPCVANDLSTWSYTYWSEGHKQTATMDLGVVSNYGSSSSQEDGSTLTGNSVEDENSIGFNIYTTPATAEVTTGFTVQVFADTLKTTSESVSLETSSMSPDAVDTTIGAAVQAELVVGAFIDDVVDNNVAIGQAKRILIRLVIPVNSRYQLDVGFTIPATYAGKIEICDAFVSSAGYNLPCVDLTTAPVFTTQEGYTVGASFSFPYVCHDQVVNTDEANTLEVEAWVRPLDNGQVDPGNNVIVTGAVSTNGIATTMSPDSVTLTVTDEANFVDKVMGNADFIPEVTTDQQSTITMGPGDPLTLKVNMTITPYSSHRMLLDVDLPRDADSACMTFTELRVIRTGQNLLCFPTTVEASSKNIEYTPNVTDYTGTGQMSYVFLNFGVITNTGKTASSGTSVAEDNLVEMEIDVRLADCSLAVQGASFNMSIGVKITNFVNIANLEVSVQRTYTEEPDLDLDFTATPEGSNIRLTGSMTHSLISTAELWNASWHFYFPTTLLAPENITLMTSTKTFSLQSSADNPSHFHIALDHFFFSDFFDFETIVTRNASVVFPDSLNFDDSVVYTEIIGDVIERTTPSPYETYPLWASSPGNFTVAVNGSGPSCNGALGLGDGSILNCQIFSSDTDVSPGTNGRYNSNNANYWRPYVRSGRLAEKRYMQIYFCNPARVKSVGILQGGTDKATEIEVSFSDDFRSWFRAQKIDSIPQTSGVVSVPEPVEAQAVRIRVTDDTQSGAAANLLLQFEVYGCYSTTDPCPTVCDDSANAAALPAVPSDFSARSMAEGYNNQLYVCDRDPDRDYYWGVCKTTIDGSDWKSVDPNVAAMIGYESVSGRMFAYGQDKSTVYYNEYAEDAWHSTDPSVLTEAKALGTWNSALALPETKDPFFDTAFATSGYKTPSQTWGATFDGVDKVGDRRVLKWSCMV